ncbi:MAG: hypothetical protein FWD57_15660 [Polyangiaceae bacterium]|nr:hypothetical protein [Polyangiaceae bacterium]
MHDANALQVKFEDDCNEHLFVQFTGCCEQVISWTVGIAPSRGDEAWSHGHPQDELCEAFPEVWNGTRHLAGPGSAFLLLLCKLLLTMIWHCGCNEGDNDLSTDGLPIQVLAQD